MKQETRSANFASQTIWTGDNLDIMRGMNSDCVDLIYLDPPFNSKANYAAPIGSKAAGAAFKDTWGLDDVKLVWHGEIKHEYPGLYALLTATRDIHGASMMSYLIYMAIRIMEMRRLLKPDGSIYVHCDPTASHYLKLLMDSVFGKANFRNEIVWAYRGMPSKARKWQQKHDTALFYTKSEKYTFNVLRTEPTAGSQRTFASAMNRGYNLNRSKKMVTVFDWDKYRQAVEAGDIPSDLNPKEFTGGRPPMMDWWTDIKILGGPKNKERTGYPTQKPLALLRRIIKGSSNEDDMVLDPFCGCATTCIAAEQLQRRWVGIDISEKAADLVQSRLQEEVGLMYQGAHRTDIPKRTDLGKIPKYNCAENRRYLYGEQGGYCNGCATHFEPRHFHVDHIVPRAKGGNDHISNLQLLCGSCNATKGQKSHEELITLLTDKGWIKRRQEIMANGNRGRGGLEI